MPELPHCVLVVHDLAGGGGMESILRAQLPLLAETWEITVLSASMHGSLLDHVTWVPVPVVGYPAWVRTVIFSVVGGVRLAVLRRRARSIMVVYWTVGAIVPQKIDVASVHFCHRGFLKAEGWRTSSTGVRKLNTTIARIVALAFESWSYRPSRVNWLFAVSTGLVGEIGAAYPGLACTVTPNGIPPQAADRKVARSPQDPLRIIFVGGDWARKGLNSCLRIMSIFGPATLTVVGNGPQALGPGLARSLGIAGRVEFVAWTENISKYYENADVILLPSTYETFGMVLFEAASYGVIPISTPVHGAVDLIEHGVSGFLFDRGDDSAVVAILESLYDDPTKMAAMSERARMSSQRFSIDQSAQVLSQMLRKVLVTKEEATS